MGTEHVDNPMRVQIVYTVEVPNEIRRAINAYYGKSGLATRAEIRDWYMTYGSSMDLDLSTDADATQGH